MPVSKEMAQEARKEIYSFVIKTRDIIGELIDPEYPGRLVDVRRPPRFIAGMDRALSYAWNEFSEDFNLSHVEELIFKTSADTLQAFGLYGSQLKAKLQLVSTMIGKYILFPTGAVIAQLLEAIDVLLDSVIKATGIYESIKEIKDLVRVSISTD